MAYTNINSEDRLVQATFAEHLEKVLEWESVYAWNQEAFGSSGTLGRATERDVVLVSDLRAALARFNPQLPAAAIDEAVVKLTHHDYSHSLLQHNQTFHKLIRDGAPVSYRDAFGQIRHAQAAVIDFRNPGVTSADRCADLTQAICRETRWCVAVDEVRCLGHERC